MLFSSLLVGARSMSLNLRWMRNEIGCEYNFLAASALCWNCYFFGIEYHKSASFNNEIKMSKNRILVLLDKWVCRGNEKILASTPIFVASNLIGYFIAYSKLGHVHIVTFIFKKYLSRRYRLIFFCSTNCHCLMENHIKFPFGLSLRFVVRLNNYKWSTLCIVDGDIVCWIIDYCFCVFWADFWC
jgi:hypothetical protein